MDKLRQAANSFSVKIILALIILGLVVSSIVGMGFFGGSQAPEDTIIQINGKSLTKSELARAVNFNQLFSEQGKLDENRVIAAQQEKFLLSLTYDKLGGANPSDALINQVVTTLPYFQVDGKYDNDQYLRVLSLSNYNGEQYVNEQVIPSIKSSVILNGLVNSDFVLPSDIDILSDLFKQERTIKVAKVTLNDLIPSDSVTITQEEVKTYYDSHLQEFQNPEKYKIKYLHISKSDFENNSDAAAITDEEIKHYYETNEDLFSEPAKKRFNLIVVNDKAKADAVAAKLANGEAFDEVAKTDSLIPENIDMGWINESDLQSTFPDFASLAKKGDYTQLENNGAIQFVQLSDTAPKVVKPLDDVKNQIVDRLKEDHILEAYKAELSKLESSNPEAYTSLDGLLSQSNVKAAVKESNWNTQDKIFDISEISYVLADGSLYTQQGSTDKISPIIYTNQGNDVYVIQVSDYQPESITPLDKVSSQINKQLKQARMETLFAEKLVEMNKELNEGKQIKSVKFNNELNLVRTQDVPSIDAALVKEAYTLIPESKSIGFVQPSATEAQFIQLVSIKDEPLLEVEQNSLMFNFDVMVKNILYYSLFSELIPDN